MKEKLKELAEKQIKIIEEVMKNLKILEDNELIELAKSYFYDAKYFFEKEDYLNSFEAITISWAYIDACLHFKKIEIQEEIKKFFTV